METSLARLLTIKRMRERVALEALHAARQAVAQREHSHRQALEVLERLALELDDHRRALLSGAADGMPSARLRLAMDHTAALALALCGHEEEVQRCADAVERAHYDVARKQQACSSARADTEKIEVQVERARAEARVHAEILAEAELEEAAAR